MLTYLILAGAVAVAFLLSALTLRVACAIFSVPGATFDLCLGTVWVVFLWNLLLAVVLVIVGGVGAFVLSTVGRDLSSDMWILLVLIFLGCWTLVPLCTQVVIFSRRLNVSKTRAFFVMCAWLVLPTLLAGGVSLLFPAENHTEQEEKEATLSIPLMVQLWYAAIHSEDPPETSTVGGGGVAVEEEGMRLNEWFQRLKAQHAALDPKDAAAVKAYLDDKARFDEARARHEAARDAMLQGGATQ